MKLMEEGRVLQRHRFIEQELMKPAAQVTTMRRGKFPRGSNSEMKRSKSSTELHKREWDFILRVIKPQASTKSHKVSTPLYVIIGDTIFTVQRYHREQIELFLLL